MTELKINKIKALPILKKVEDEKEEKFLREMGEYEFMNIEESGLAIKFPYGNTKNNYTFHFMHGGKYKIPRFIARHVESCETPIWEWRPNGLGGMAKKLVGRKPRFQMREVYTK